jgi:ligand-binding SRPBCC domain-containing protein
MTTIKLETIINAPIKICYDLSRSIDLHVDTNSSSKEKAIEGKTTGLIEANEFVTWKAKHFGLPQRMTVKITDTIQPFFFQDQMVEGPFRRMQHAHIFQQQNGHTIMRDEFQYEVPFGIIGKFFDKLVLKRYMSGLLIARNEMIKRVAETGTWTQYLQTA